MLSSNASNAVSTIVKSCVLAKRAGTRGFVYASTAENSNSG